MDDEEYQGGLGDFGDEGEASSADGTEDKGAIAEVDNGDIIHFKLNPESIEDSKDTEFANIDIPAIRGISSLAAGNACYRSQFICIRARARTCLLQLNYCGHGSMLSTQRAS